MSVVHDYWLANRTVETYDTPGLPQEPYMRCPQVVCADGFAMSVQASYGHYCHPRKSLPDGGYTAFEVGFPSQVEALLLPYAEDDSAPTKTVYGFVPTQVLDEIVANHGGLKS